MHQKAAIIKALARSPRARAATSAREKAQAFFDMVSEQPDICWSKELVQEFRSNYYDVCDEILSVLFATDDPLIIFQCVQHADFSQPQELEAFQRFIQSCNAEKHQVILRALAETRRPEFMKALKQRKELPESVREVLSPSKKSERT
jgi:hypothetical protein